MVATRETQVAVLASPHVNDGIGGTPSIRFAHRMLGNTHAWRLPSRQCAVDLA